MSYSSEFRDWLSAIPYDTPTAIPAYLLSHGKTDPYIRTVISKSTMDAVLHNGHVTKRRAALRRSAGTIQLWAEGKMLWVFHTRRVCWFNSDQRDQVSQLLRPYGMSWHDVRN